MRLYLLRHGEPQPEKKDPRRRLTPRGKLDIATIGRFLEQNGLYIPEIWHSNKPRVIETAEIIARAVGTTRLLQKPGLAPLDHVGPIRADLLEREDDIMLVGHLPFLSRLANQLLGVQPEIEIFRFMTGEIACLERNAAKHWRMIFSIYPRLLE